MVKLYLKYEKIINNLVTGDEAWVYYFEPELKEF